MDYDDDGDLDVLSGSYTGEVYLLERGEDGKFARGRYLLDSDGKVLEVGISVTVEAVDMDGDGDLDLVVGTRSQGVRIVENVGTRRAPSWAPTPRQLKTRSGKRLDGSNAHVADWDQDGVDDLIVGAENGGVFWHRNEGTNDAPVHADAVVLVPARPLGEQLRVGDVPKGPGLRTKVHAGDWDDDGVLDLLVGDVQWAYYDLPPLTGKQLADQEALRPEYERARAEEKALLDERNGYVRARKPIPAEFEERYQALRKRVLPIYSAWSEFRRERSTTHGWVWMYRGQGAGAKVADAAPRASDSSKLGPTSLSAVVAPVAGRSGTFKVTVEVQIAAGWHIYAHAPDGYTGTKVGLELPDGVERLSDWSAVTSAHPAAEGSATTWFEHSAVFACEVKPVDIESLRLPVTVELQACNERMCMAPVTLRRVAEPRSR